MGKRGPKPKFDDPTSPEAVEHRRKQWRHRSRKRNDARRARGEADPRPHTQFSYRLERKQQLAAIHGGECARCGFTPATPAEWCAMDFHHLDPATKRFEINGAAMSRKWETLEEEARRCQLLCATCHRIVEFDAPPATAKRRGRPIGSYTKP